MLPNEINPFIGGAHMENNNNLAGKRLLLLGGVRQSCEIIEEAKRMGVETFVTDYDKDSPAKKIADHAFLVNAIDVDAVVQLCREQKIDGVITGYVDMLLPYCQQICEKLGKPFWGNADNIAMCTDKYQFKLACEKAGVPVVPWVRATKENYMDLLESVKVPVVIKPVDNSGSRGVVKCFEASKLQESIEKSLSFSKSGVVLIEKAMDIDEEFSTYYMMNHGKYYMTLMGDRYVYVVDEGVAPVGHGMTYPSIHLKKWMDEVDPAIRCFFDQNDMKNGFAFFQGFYDKDEQQLCVHEIGFRPVGGFSFKYVEHFSHFNRIRELIRFSLTGSMDESELEKTNPFFDGYAITVTASLKPGVIGSVEGADKIRGMKEVIHFRELKEKGTEILPSTQGTLLSVFAYILCVVKTKEERARMISVVQENLKVLDSNGNNMLNHFLDASELKI